MKTFLFFIGMVVLLFMNLLTIVNSFKCGADLIKMDPIKIPRRPKTQARQLADTPRPIIIRQEEMLTDNINVTPEKKSQAVESLKQAIKIFEALIIVNSPRIINFSGHDILCERKISNELKQDLDVDVVIFPKFASLEQQVVAAALLCVTESERGKPIAGILLINPNYNSDSTNIDAYLQMLFLHELTHILVFNPRLIPDFITAEGNFYAQPIIITSVINNISKKKIATPRVIAAAKQHFGCDTLDGVEIEDQGGNGSVGSHWESRIMLGDYMISSDYPENVISDITLALFEDSGWYTVNKYSGGLFRFGKNQGCKFLNQPCIKDTMPLSNNDFCNVSLQNRCFAGRTGKGVCYLTTSLRIPTQFQYYKDTTKGGFEPADFCPVAYANSDKTYFYQTSCKRGEINNALKDLGEVIGDNSVCMISSLKNEANASKIMSLQPMCYQVACSTTELTVTIQGKTITCPKQGGIIESPEGFSGSLYCPDYNLICTGSTFCTDAKSCVDEKSTLKENLDYIVVDSQIKADKQSDEAKTTSQGSILITSNIIIPLLIVSLFL